MELEDKIKKTKEKGKEYYEMGKQKAGEGVDFLDRKIEEGQVKYDQIKHDYARKTTKGFLKKYKHPLAAAGTGIVAWGLLGPFGLVIGPLAYYGGKRGYEYLNAPKDTE